MKSSVINSGNGGNNPPQHPQNATTSAQIDGNNNPPQGQNQGQNQRYPFYDFDMDDPRDFFTNPALRSRLNRMRNPWNVNFGAPRKRPNQAPEEEDSGFVEDPHESFFTKFDPHWDTTQWPRSNIRKRQPNDFGAHGDFFDHFPAEFRQYIPDDFGFHHQPMGHHGHQVPMTHQAPTQRQVPPQTRFCDAAMQTDDEPPTPSTDTETSTQAPAAPLKQHGLRNTVDLGQKSPQEEREERAKSAPPDAEAQTAEVHTKGVQSDPVQEPSSPSQNVRHIPIIVERTQKAPVPQPPKRGVSQKKFVLKPQVPTDAPAPETAAVEQEARATQEAHATQPQAPPTPSAESIGKIQQIQNEVLELMFKVEAFQGTSRADKEYLWLDEMLTRNLLKLDTIDTQGNDRIRLARREAIKCIQASLAVLEAKADGTVKKDAAPQTSSSNEFPEEIKESAPDVESTSEIPTEVPEDKSKIPIPLPPVEPHPAAEPEDMPKDEDESKPAKEEEEKTEEKPKKKKVVKKVVKKDTEVQNNDEQT